AGAVVRPEVRRGEELDAADTVGVTVQHGRGARLVTWQLQRVRRDTCVQHLQHLQAVPAVHELTMVEGADRTHPYGRIRGERATELGYIGNTQLFPGWRYSTALRRRA